MSKNKRTVYFGFGEKSEFLQWDWDTLFNHVFENCLVSIAKGTIGLSVDNGQDLRAVFYMSVRMVAAWALYHDKGT